MKEFPTTSSGTVCSKYEKKQKKDLELVSIRKGNCCLKNAHNFLDLDNGFSLIFLQYLQIKRGNFKQGGMCCNLHRSIIYRFPPFSLVSFMTWRCSSFLYGFTLYDVDVVIFK